jgi:hypothetical protein
MSGFGSTGWGDVDDYGASGSDGGSTYGPRRFWMPAEATKRIMFLDGDPFCFYEHSLWGLNKSRDKSTCLKKNGIDERGCPLCDLELWPSFTGYFSIIDMGDVSYGSKGDVTLTGWTSKKGVTYQFGRSLYGAKRGGKDKPGVLKKIQRLAQKQGGDLTGTVWDVFRSGSKVESVGDELEFVERVAKEDWREYLVELGANEEYLELEPFDYQKVFEPKSYDALKRLCGDIEADDEAPF